MKNPKKIKEYLHNKMISVELHFRLMFLDFHNRMISVNLRLMSVIKILK